MDFIVDHHPDFVVTHKPANWDFHDCDGNQGFYHWVQDQLGEELWPVHRLDKVTSGLLLFSRSKQACANIAELFAQNSVHKVYLAIAEGSPKKKQGQIRGDMARSRRGSWKLLRTQTNPAITQFQSLNLKPKVRVYWLKPSTGKTHQLRVALKSLGTPILGDELYGGAASDRVYLHAYQLGFEYQQTFFNWSLSPTLGELFLTSSFQAVIEQFKPVEQAATKRLDQ